MADYIDRKLAKRLFANDHDYGLAKRLDEVPTADVVEVVPELRKTVELLCKEYEKAKQNPIVRDPLAYALYQAWKAVDGRRKMDGE